MKMRTKLKICGIQWKQCLQEILEHWMYISGKKQESKTDNLNFYIRMLEKEQIKSKVSRRKDIIKTEQKSIQFKTGDQYI